MLLNNRFCIWENRISDVEVKLKKKNPGMKKQSKKRKKQNLINEGK